MHRVRVKIEGLRDPATAVEVARLGADAIGVVFADSPRHVTPEAAREIVAALPPWVAAVGVFVNVDAAEINCMIEEVGIQYVQLHGDEQPEDSAGIHATCIKAFHVRDEHWVRLAREWIAEAETCSGRKPAVLLDAYDPAVRGGSGRRFNWDLIARSRERGEMARLGPIILAGGLDAACVGEAIRKVQPWAVDVASGVECAPGVKDLGKVRAFIDAVRAAEQS